jgi:hypothetical protein
MRIDRVQDLFLSPYAPDMVETVLTPIWAEAGWQ